MAIRSSEAEKGFSLINLIVTDVRNRISITHVSILMFIKLEGPPLSKFSPNVFHGLRTHRSANKFANTYCSKCQHADSITLKLFGNIVNQSFLSFLFWRYVSLGKCRRIISFICYVCLLITTSM